MLSNMSRSESEGSLKGKHSLAFGAQLHSFFQHASIAEIDVRPENLRQSNL